MKIIPDLPLCLRKKTLHIQVNTLSNPKTLTNDCDLISVGTAKTNYLNFFYQFRRRTFLRKNLKRRRLRERNRCSRDLE